MTQHRTVPSEIEPDTLIDLVNDCQELPMSPAAAATRLIPQPRHVAPAAPGGIPLVFTEQMAHLVDGIEDYGS